MRIGIDIGGTFTDLVLVDDETGAVEIFKLLTTHGNPGDAVENGFTTIVEAAGASPRDVAHVRHGTTLVTNAVLERRGAKVALVTTEGFRDVLDIATEDRFDLYDLHLRKPDPIVARRDTFTVTERILADGSVATPLDVHSLERVVAALAEGGYESLAVALLHSYRNPEHEERLRDFVAERLPRLEISISSQVSPEIREYERASTTAVNAYVVPVVKTYLNQLGERLQATGTEADLLLMLSSGGICTAATAAAYPVRLIESGPAAGALAAAEIARLAGVDSVLSFDLGGTTAKGSLIVDGEPLFTPGLEVARQFRFKAGSGLPLQVRSVDLIEIGAGGGSIARVDELGLVQVGPESAGSEPGPACYGRGGTMPTVTDADLVLGYLDAGSFLGGTMALDLEAARSAIAREVGDPLGLDVVAAAEAIRRMVNENMASAFRIYALEHGYEPSRFPMVAFGGAGPVHACGVARIVGSERLMVPPGAGVNSAYGLLTAPLAFDFVRSDLGLLGDVDWAQVNRYVAEMEQEGREILTASGVPEADQTIVRLCDMRFSGQGHELSVTASGGELDKASGDELRERFSEQYAQLYSHVPQGVDLEVVSWRVLVSGPRAPLVMSAPTRPGSPKVLGTRPVHWGAEHGTVDTTVLDRYALEPGDDFEGPVIVEERESTTALDPRTRLKVDEHLNLVVDLY